MDEGGASRVPERSDQSTLLKLEENPPEVARPKEVGTKPLVLFPEIVRIAGETSNE